MATKTIDQYNRQRARKLERKDEEVAWLLNQRTRLCELCGKGYTANSPSTPNTLKVRRWHGIEVCRDCEASRLEIIQALLKMGILKFSKKHKEKVRWPVRWKTRDPRVFVHGNPATWSQGCDICKIYYHRPARGYKKLKWKGMEICYNCLKSIRLIPRLIELGVVKYTKEYR